MAEERAWSTSDLQLPKGGRNELIQDARCEMIPDNCCHQSDEEGDENVSVWISMAPGVCGNHHVYSSSLSGSDFEFFAKCSSDLVAVVLVNQLRYLE